MKPTFRVSRRYPKILRNRKRRIERRLAPRQWEGQEEPMMRGSNIHYELSDRIRGSAYGGMGAVHLMVQRLGLVEEIDRHLELLKVHLPYHESDHVLNIAYNVLVGGQRLEDIELRRQDESFLDGLGAQRIPDPTTAGDFTRRFAVQDIIQLQESINRTRQRVWRKQPQGFLAEAFLDVDGTIAATYGECKGGMGLSYKGIWGYAPLVVSLANTREVLYVVNRPGNAPSHQDSVEWIDRAVELVQPLAGRITLRGDTDFSNTAQLDRWDDRKLNFILGLDAHPKVVGLAQELSERCWRALERLPKYEILTEPRARRHRIKEQIVVQKGYENRKLVAEHVCDISYQPHQCGRKYRLCGEAGRKSTPKSRRNGVPCIGNQQLACFGARRSRSASVTAGKKRLRYSSSCRIRDHGRGRHTRPWANLLFKASNGRLQLGSWTVNGKPG